MGSLVNICLSQVIKVNSNEEIPVNTGALDLMEDGPLSLVFPPNTQNPV